MKTVDVDLYVIKDDMTGMRQVLPNDLALKEQEADARLELNLAQALMGDEDVKEQRRGESIRSVAELKLAALKQIAEHLPELKGGAERLHYVLNVPKLRDRIYAHMAATEVDAESGEKWTVDGKLMVELLLPNVQGLKSEEVDELDPSIQEALWSRMSRAMRPDPVRLPFFSLT